jgi:hypothetical protein
VIDHGADGVGTGAARTRINTLHADTSQGWTTLGTDKTFRSAVRWRANVPGQARADTDTVHFSLLAVGSTRVRIARIKIFNHWFSSWRYVAFPGWISNVTFQAGALGDVVKNIADSVDTASSWARVFTLLVDASFVRWTFAVENTLRPTGEVGITLEAWQAFTGSSSAKF